MSNLEETVEGAWTVLDVDSPEGEDDTPEIFNEDEGEDEKPARLEDDNLEEKSEDLESPDPDVEALEIELDSEEEEEPEEESAEAEEPQEKEDKEEYSSRAEKRIRELARQKNEALEQAQREAAEKAALEKRLRDLEREASVSRKTALDQQAMLLEDRLKNTLALKRRAREEGDLDREEELEAIANDTRIDLRIIKEQSTSMEIEEDDYEAPESYEQAPPQAPPSRQEILSRLPQEAQEWASDKEWFLADQQATQLALILSGQLENSGVAITDPDHYVELNQRLSAVLPHLFPKEEKAKEEPAAKKESKPKTPVAASSKQPIKRNAKRRSIKLTPEMRERARIFGMTDKEYAEAYAKFEMEEESHDGMTSNWKSVF